MRRQWSMSTAIRHAAGGPKQRRSRLAIGRAARGPRRAAGTGAGQGATAPRKPWRGGLGRAAGTESYHN
jgi:hypothetical protein